MTFTNQTATTLDGFAQDIRDKITAETGFSVAKDQVGTDLVEGDVTIIDCPGKDYVRLNYNSISTANDEGAHARFEHGTYDSGTDSWTRWSRTGIAFQNKDYDSNNIGPSMNVEYWAETTARGFAVFVRRVEGDGSDNSAWFSWQEIQPLWDYTTANTVESSGFIMGHYGDANDVYLSEAGPRTENNCTTEGGFGLLNPDTDLNNFPWVEWVIRSNAYQNGDTGKNAPIGTANIGLYDRSGGDSNSGDVIQDSGGADTYKVLKYNNVEPLLMRMD